MDTTTTLTGKQAARALAALAIEADLLKSTLEEAIRHLAVLAEIGRRLERDAHGDLLEE